MNTRCKHTKPDSHFCCGSLAFNLHQEGIDQGQLCDRHYWQVKAALAVDALKAALPLITKHGPVELVLQCGAAVAAQAGR